MNKLLLSTGKIILMVEELKYWNKNLPQCHSLHQKSHMNRTGIEPWPVW